MEFIRATVGLIGVCLAFFMFLRLMLGQSQLANVSRAKGIVFDMSGLALGITLLVISYYWPFIWRLF